MLIYFLLIPFAICFLYHQTNYIHKQNLTVTINKLPKEFRNFTIIQISDLHGKCFGNKQDKLLKVIAQQQFDILVLTGDMFKDNDGLESLSSVKYIVDYVHDQNQMVYFVAGNHDLNANYHQIVTELSKWGVEVLDNRTFIIKRNDQFLNIIGIKDALFGMANLDKAMENVANGVKILLAHTIFKRKDKSLFQKIKNFKIDLVLTGHTHGSQINLFPFGKIYITGEGFFPRFLKGLHRIESSYIYINRGLGTSGINIRIFSRPEITCITLVQE